MKFWFGQMERDIKDFGLERQALAGMWVPDGRPAMGTMYLSSAEFNQVDDLESRRPSKGINTNIHPFLAEALKGAVKMAVDENKGFSQSEKDDTGKPVVLGHTNCFGCAEITALHFFIRQRISKDVDSTGYPTQTIFTAQPRLQIVDRKFEGKGSPVNPIIPAMPSSNVVNVAKGAHDASKVQAVAKKYPNNSTAGRKHFIKLLGIFNDALEAAAV